jgi:hypothetical protein
LGCDLLAVHPLPTRGIATPILTVKDLIIDLLIWYGFQAPGPLRG